MTTPNGHRRVRGAVVGLVALSLVAVACGSDDGDAAASATPTTTTIPTTTAAAHTAAAELSAGMRTLWEQHVTWTRLFIVSVTSGLPDADATAQRLLRNQDDIGNAIKPFYGDAAGAELTTLLRTHITTAADLLSAAKANDATAVATAKDAWYANADDIAAFLSKANPDHWPEATLKDAMHMHLDQTLAEATDRLAGDTAKEIADYDAIEHHILAMADTLSAGIVAQFPDRFAA